MEGSEKKKKSRRLWDSTSWIHLLGKQHTKNTAAGRVGGATLVK